jgi:hypothetical protein
MDDHITVDPVKEDPVVEQVPDAAVVPEEAVEDGKDKEPKIDIKQVPIDGVCGGY